MPQLNSREGLAVREPYPTFSGALVRKTGTQAVSATTEVNITWDAEDYDTDSYHDNVTNNHRMTIPVDGIYMAGAGVALSGGIAGIAIYLKSDTGYEATSYVDSPGSPNNICVSPPLEMVAGRYFYVALYLTAARTVEPSGTTFFWVRRIA